LPIGYFAVADLLPVPWADWDLMMTRIGVGVMHNTINSRFGPKPLVRADYMTGVACGADSFWVADHLNSVLPPSMWTPKHVGAARIIPQMDAHLEPWTMLGYVAAKSRVRMMRLGVAVTDTGRRNPAVTAQAAASLHLLTRGRAVLGIGTGERESNAPYGVEWTKPVARFEEAVATIRALWDGHGELRHRKNLHADFTRRRLGPSWRTTSSRSRLQRCAGPHSPADRRPPRWRMPPRCRAPCSRSCSPSGRPPR
jgi:Luciferase-like monooxygenase